MRVFELRRDVIVLFARVFSKLDLGILFLLIFACLRPFLGLVNINSHCLSPQNCRRR